MIKKDFLVEKRNILNEIRANNMTLQELRFFSIYLSRINARDINTRVVRFPMSDFQKIMEIGRMNIKHLKNVTDSLLCKIVRVPDERGGYVAFQLFKKCRVSLDESNEWFVEIDAHDESLPLMFDFKKDYFTYQLWNALRLKSTNQLRMYEVLKQYEPARERIISLDNLRFLLGINPDEYRRFGDFKIRVLDSCQKALIDNTDIGFTYEPYGKKGKGGKIFALKFTISKNENYVDQLTLDEFIQQKDIDEIEEEGSIDFKNEHSELLKSACNDEFSMQEIRIIADMLLKIIPFGNYQNGIQLEQYDYLRRKYNELEYRASKKEIPNRFGYLKKIIEVDL